VFAFLTSILALTVNVQEVSGAAFPIPDHIGILLSDTCITMHENNFTTDCPTYEELLQIYEDTSNHAVSGGFDYNEHGFYERQKPIMKEHLRFYTFEEKLIQWIDPPADLLLGAHKRIIIAANPFEYKILDQTITNASHYVGNNRYVGSTCNYAIVSAQYWLEWVGDSLYYLLNDCDPDFTRYNSTSLKKWEGTTHNIETSQKWINEQWLKEIKQECSTNCNYLVTNITNPSINPDHIIKTNGVNYTLHFEETLRFSDGSTNQANHTEKEINPCMKDPRSLICEVYRYHEKNKILEIPEENLNLNLTTKQTNMTNAEVNPCEEDPKGILCKVWEYEQAEHEVNQSSYLKFRNAVAGAIGE
jgi:hypothetical protein